MDQLSAAQGDEINQEKKARALSVLAKTVETLAQIEGRIINNPDSQSTDVKENSDEQTTMDGQRSLQFYRELENIFAEVGGKRSVEGSPSST